MSFSVYLFSRTVENLKEKCRPQFFSLFVE